MPILGLSPLVSDIAMVNKRLGVRRSEAVGRRSGDPSRPGTDPRLESQTIALAAVVLTLTAFPGCGPPSEAPLSGADSLEVITTVEAATWAFHAADTARNAEAVVGLLWPEYAMFADGTRLTYPEAAAGARAFMATLTLFHTDWTDLRVTPLGRDAAVASFRFRDSIITRTGEAIRSRGTTSFVWQRRGAEWRVLYADANHRPIAP